jgi:hypothetical protein
MLEGYLLAMGDVSLQLLCPVPHGRPQAGRLVDGQVEEADQERHECQPGIAEQGQGREDCGTPAGPRDPCQDPRTL